MFNDLAKALPVEALDRRARQDPDRTFVVFADGEEWSYARTAEEAWKTANALREHGVVEGDFVSVWLPGGKDAVRLFFGILAVGAVFAPLNLSYRGRLLEHVVNITRSKLLVGHQDLLERLDGLDLPDLKAIVAMSGDRDRARSVNGINVAADELRGAPDRPVLERPRHPSDPMSLIFTSGTTGASKGVLQSYIYCEEFTDGGPYKDMGPDDRLYLCLPVFHIPFPTFLSKTVRCGGSVVVAHGFTASSYWSEVRNYGVTKVILVASMAAVLLEQPVSADDRNHAVRTVALSPNIPENKEFERRFGLLPVSAYGSSEVGLPLTTGAIGEDDYTTCGWLRPGYEARIVDAFDQELCDGEVGELVVRADRPWSLSSGYKGMPEATANLWRNGWMHTGDAFRRDADGRYYFVDRKKDMIRRRGENISSAEVETEVVSYPGVQRAAAFGVPDPRGEEEVMVLVECSPSVRIDPEQLTRYLVERLPHFMVPRYIEVCDELPITAATMRVQKAELRSKGVTSNTWDREAAGIVLKRERLR